MVRIPPLHGGDRGFESHSGHFFFNLFFDAIKLIRNHKVTYFFCFSYYLNLLIYWFLYWDRLIYKRINHSFLSLINYKKIEFKLTNILNIIINSLYLFQWFSFFIAYNDIKNITNNNILYEQIVFIFIFFYKNEANIFIWLLKKIIFKLFLIKKN